MKRLRLLGIGVCFVLWVSSAMASTIFDITLPTTTVHLNPARSGTLTFTAKNVSGITLNKISVPQTQFLTPTFSATVVSNTCDNTTLANNQSCTVTLNISGVTDGSASLSPVVCAFSGLACSHGNVTIKVDNVVQSPPVTTLAATLPNNVQVGTSYPIVASFLNTDTQNSMTGVSITKAPVDCVETANTCQSGVLAPLATCQISYLFTAPFSGSYHLTGTFSYNEGSPIINSKTVLASEAAIAGSVVTGLPANIEQDRTYPVIFRYTNFGTADATYSAVANPNPTLGAFTPKAGLLNPCTAGGTLAKGAFCDISGTYKAGAAGSAMLSSTLTATGPGTINPVPLMTASTASDVAVMGTVLPALPTTIIPGVSYNVVFTFTNSNPTLPAEKVSIDKLLPAANFTQTSDSCGATLAAGASCAIGGTYQTSVEGPVSLTVLFDHDDNDSVPLTTSSEATAAALVGTVNGFPANVDKDTAHTATFTFSNHGIKDAVVNSTTLSFPNIDGAVTNNCTGQTIPPGGSCTISGAFKNAPAGATTWGATVNYNGGVGGNPINVVKTTNTTVGDTLITGTNTTPVPANVPVSTNRSFQFTFTNSASSPTSATDVQFVTAMPHVTGLTNSCTGSTTLAPGGTCVVSGIFNSSHSGPQTLSATLLYKQGASVAVNNTTMVTPVLPQTVNISATTSYSSPNMSQYSLDGTKRAGFVVLPELQPSTVTGAPTSLIWITYGTTPFSIALQRVQDGQLYAINLLGGRSTACGTFTMNSAASCYSDTGRFILSSGDNTNLPSGTYTGQLVVSMQDWVSTYRQVLDLNITYSK